MVAINKLFGKWIIFTVLLSISVLGLSINNAEAGDTWVYTNAQNGYSTYVVYESVVYGNHTSFYARARIKQLDSSVKLISSPTWEFGRDEGEWRYGDYGSNTPRRRVYDDEDATALLNWLQAHSSEAHNTADPTKRVLGN